MYTDDAQQDRKHQQSNAQHQVVRCANCDIEILWPPTVVQGKPFCCTGCAAGGPATAITHSIVRLRLQVWFTILTEIA